MIAEDYCSYEVAKLLKEKGFPQEYDLYHSMVYNEEDYEDEYEVQRMVLETKLVKTGTLSSYPIGVPEPKCYCPTHQMAMRWLRESHNLYIEPFVVKNYNNNKLEYTYSIQDLDFNGSDDGIDCCKDWNSPEEACEAAIKYCLEKLI